MTLKQLQKKLAERFVTLSIQYSIRKKLFCVKTSMHGTPDTKVEHIDLETAVRMAFDQDERDHKRGRIRIALKGVAQGWGKS